MKREHERWIYESSESRILGSAVIKLNRRTRSGPEMPYVHMCLWNDGTVSIDTWTNTESMNFGWAAADNGRGCTDGH